MGKLSPDNSLDDIKIRIRKSYSNPNVGSITQVVLKDGPQAYRFATLLEVINPRTNEFHHYSLKIDQINRTKNGWFSKSDKSVRLEGKDPDEIATLFMFLQSSQEGRLKGKEGDLHLIRSEDYANLEKLIDVLPNIAESDKLQLVKTIFSQLKNISSSTQEFVEVFKNSDQETLKRISSASRLVKYRHELDELVRLVEEASTSESELQKHLKKNPWMFGSEYSELLSRRTWTRDEELDYMLRRTVDNYLEIVEIKTAFPDSLFIYDRGRNCYYPSSKLSPVIGQVSQYIEEVERNRDQIIAKDRADPLKIRAKAVVGRDGSEAQQSALRNLNAHLSRIEILTFDQLIRIAGRVLSIFDENEEESTGVMDASSDDIPF